MTVHNIRVSQLQAFLSYGYPLVSCCPDNRGFPVLQLGKSKWETTISNYLQNPCCCLKFYLCTLWAVNAKYPGFTSLFLSVITSACNLSYSNSSIECYSTVCKQAFPKCQNHFHIVHIKVVTVKTTNRFLKYTDIHNKSTLLQVHPLSLPSPVLTSLKMSVDLWMSLWAGHWVVETVLISTSLILQPTLPRPHMGEFLKWLLLVSQ